MSDALPPFQYRQYNTKRSSTASERVSTEILLTTPTAKPMIPSPIASAVPSPVPSVIYSPVPSVVYSPVPSIVYSPYDTPAGSPSPGSPAHGSPVIPPTGSPVSSHHGTTVSRSSSSGPTSSSSSSTDVPGAHGNEAQQMRSGRSRPHASISGTGSRRRRHTISVYGPNDSRRQASMNQAAETGRPARYGLTRDARVASMQANGKVRLGRERGNTPGCCVIL